VWCRTAAWQLIFKDGPSGATSSLPRDSSAHAARGPSAAEAVRGGRVGGRVGGRAALPPTPQGRDGAPSRVAVSWPVQAAPQDGTGCATCEDALPPRASGGPIERLTLTRQPPSFGGRVNWTDEIRRSRGGYEAAGGAVSRLRLVPSSGMVVGTVVQGSLRQQVAGGNAR
jgi:hypothetical protein